MTYKVEDLALAYELRQTGMCWKRIAQGFDDDDRALRCAVWNCVRIGVTKWENGYARQAGRPPVIHLDVIKAAHRMKKNSKLAWRVIAEHLGVDSEKLRMAHQYANKTGLLA